MARIGIDVRKLKDFGIGTYIQNVLSHLSPLDRENEYYLFGYEEELLKGLHLGSNFRFVYEGAARYGFREHVSLPLQIRRLRLDLFHAPHYVLPYFVPATPIVTVHDIIHILFPEYLPTRRGFYYARLVMGRSIAQAACVLTVSNSSKRDILEHFTVDPDKVQVVYNGIDELFLAPATDAERQRARDRYRLDAPFFLYVGNTKRHKNVEGLVEAFRILKADGRFAGHKLVIIGSDATKHPSVRSAVAQGNIQADVRFLGWIPKEFLPAVYQMADCFVYPSLYEGFGLPPLEAMASRTPVVCSSASSLPEIAGQGAILVEPRDTRGMADAVLRIATDPSLRRKLVDAGVENVKRFSWKTSAAQLLDCFRRVFARRAARK